MKARTEECRWRYSAETPSIGEPLGDAWETACGQWMACSDGTPSADGFRNGFCFCPYCGGPLLLQLAPRMPSVGLPNESNA